MGQPLHHAPRHPLRRQAVSARHASHHGSWTVQVPEPRCLHSSRMGQARPAGAPTRTSTRRVFVRLLVLVGLIALWQVLSLLYGPYWASSPWMVLTRTIAELRSGDLL